LPQSEAIFNYLGQFDQTFSESSLWKLARENRGSTRHPQATRPYLLEINGLIVGGQLRLDWTYSERLHRKETIDAIAQTCLKVLSQLIAHCQSPEAGGYTPSDFPQARLNQSLLDRLMTKFNDIGGKQ
jgi:non-ribosomal peptide synthase protein (TIGR01720 family)